MSRRHLPANAGQCPCCGAAVSRERVIVDLPTNVVIFNQRIRVIMPKGAEMLWLLVNAFPHPMSKSELVRKIYGATEKSWSESGLSVILHHIRKDLTELGLAVVATNLDGVAGYRLSIGGDPTGRPTVVGGIQANVGEDFARKQNLSVNADLEAQEAPPARTPGSSHGTHRKYKSGCRCDECVAYFRWYGRNYKRMLRARPKGLRTLG